VESRAVMLTMHVNHFLRETQRESVNQVKSETHESDVPSTQDKQQDLPG